MITVHYTFTQALQNRIFVERGEARSQQTFNLDEKQLTPATREAALSALVVKGHQTLITDPKQLDSYAADNLRAVGVTTPHDRLTLDWAPVESEPTTETAIADAETAFIAAAALAPVLLTAAEQRAARRAIERAEKLAESIASYLQRPLRDWLSGGAGDYNLDNYRHRMGDLPPATDDLRRLDPRLDARAAEAEAEAVRLNAAHAAELANNQVLRRQLLTEHGSVDQVERFDAGVFPITELRELASSRLFGWSDGLPLYERLTEADVPHDDDCQGEEPKFRSDEYEGSLTAQQWAARKEIASRVTAMPQFELETRLHEGYCDDRSCDAGKVTRLGLRVATRWAGLTFTEEFAL